MALRKANARDLIVEVHDGGAPGTWIEVGGLNSAVLNPAENQEETETTTFDSVGDYESEIMQRGATLTLGGFLLEDDVTGAQDAGQARCEVLFTGKATQSLGQVRFRRPVHTLWKVWPAATFSPSEQGGGNNDKTGWGCTIRRSGASTTTPVA